MHSKTDSISIIASYIRQMKMLQKQIYAIIPFEIFLLFLKIHIILHLHFQAVYATFFNRFAPESMEDSTIGGDLDAFG